MEYVRNCSKCGIELKTTNKYYFQRAVNENKKCLSCSLHGRVFSDEHKANLSKNHADVRGHNNPFKNKKHTTDSINKMLDSRLKHPTWKDNSAENMRQIRNQYWGDANPMDNPESVRKIRIKRIEEIKTKSIDGQISPNYNPSSIPIIEAKARKLGITDLQHAENGGEFYIKELGYWVDGYSKEKNIVIEYDEPHHFKNGELQPKDIRRMNLIISKLNCIFVRLDYNGNITKYENKNN
jgi:hypothetical protein